MTDEEFKALAIRCQEGTATEAEKDRFDQAYRLLVKRHKGWDNERMGEEDSVKSTIFQALIMDMDRYQQRKKRFSFYKYAAAAALILSVGIGYYFYPGTKHVSEFMPLQSAAYKNDLEPGSNKATLTLADGRRIDLSGKKNGIIIQSDKLTYTDGMEIETGLSVLKGRDVAKQNTISVPQGGQYQVCLADGTNVWLNAGSSLTYPTNLGELIKRKVTLRGEAYFEVARKKHHPFIVETAFQQVRVLGTHFNVYAYEDEMVTKTTLLEGSVRVSLLASEKDGNPVKNLSSALLRPNQQSVYVAGNKDIEVGEVYAEEAIAWQRGYFMFSNEPLESVMNKISRWYDVKITFNDPSLRQEVVFGSVSRSEKASGVLKKLELTGVVRFEIKEDTIYVFRK